MPATEELLPGVDQRFCVRHLYNNFRKKFPGKKLKDIMWRAATASTQSLATSSQPPQNTQPPNASTQPTTSQKGKAKASTKEGTTRRKKLQPRKGPIWKP